MDQEIQTLRSKLEEEIKTRNNKVGKERENVALLQHKLELADSQQEQITIEKEKLETRILDLEEVLY